MALHGEAKRLEQGCGALGVRAAVAGRIVGRNPDQFGEKALLRIALASEKTADGAHRVEHVPSVH